MRRSVEGTKTVRCRFMEQLCVCVLCRLPANTCPAKGEVIHISRLSCPSRHTGPDATSQSARHAPAAPRRAALHPNVRHAKEVTGSYWLALVS